jgi:hypothetical protein
MELMKAELASLSLAAFLFVSCDKSGTKANPDETSSKIPQQANPAGAPTAAEKAAHTQRDLPGTGIRSAIASPLSHPFSAEMIRTAGTAPEDGAWQALTIEQKIEKFNSSGIAHIPKDVSDKILNDATRAPNPEDQILFITQQAAAWHHLNEFKESINDIPEHMKQTLLERLSKKHGGSWKDMATELDEQVDASVRVMELRLNGIPGMSPDASQDLLIKALEKHGPDYKTILSIADQEAGK